MGAVTDGTSNSVAISEIVADTTPSNSVKGGVAVVPGILVITGFRYYVRIYTQTFTLHECQERQHNNGYLSDICRSGTRFTLSGWTCFIYRFLHDYAA
ncbi:MAG: hypothetical protein LBU65_07070 [Planctomycetaceae bacterium]|nr:hypothetical protein [Planctomycetaceae bacterium]